VFDSSTSEPDAVHCKAGIALFEGIMNLPPDDAAFVLRQLVASQRKPTFKEYTGEVIPLSGQVDRHTLPPKKADGRHREPNMFEGMEAK
jgi:hypothetical protein